MEKEFAEFLSEELLDLRIPMAAARIIWPLALLIGVKNWMRFLGCA